MKTLATLLIIALTSLMNAQSSYEKGMEAAFDFWKNQKSQEAVNLFERIAKAEKENWLPYYYAAQVNIVNTFALKDRKEIELLLQKAQEHLNEAKTIAKHNVEIILLEALFHTAKMMTDPATLGATLSPKIEGLYQQAKTMEPNNPRAIASHAEWNMGAAKYFGKDPNIYCPELKKAIALFETEKDSVPFYPKWGKERAEMLLKQCE